LVLARRSTWQPQLEKATGGCAKIRLARHSYQST
jgi:hypothetical protein